MPRRFPRVSALEWSPTSHVKARLSSEGAEGAGKDVMGDSTLSLVDVGECGGCLGRRNTLKHSKNRTYSWKKAQHS
ncbi:hypothetical protein E2C01_101158 [Portunus trituberculatus]|uniref:Uncharacterized protein n=1 Tax=Portunus trituberculatus TaxID=210409 RepID=A0A5B7KJD4_PORTR|nr:hypothetical protein [Portunus trituberculatus]